MNRKPWDEWHRIYLFEQIDVFYKSYQLIAYIICICWSWRLNDHIKITMSVVSILHVFLKTLIRIVKDMQMQFLKYLFEKRGGHFDFLPSFCWTSCQKSYWYTRCERYVFDQGTTSYCFILSGNATGKWPWAWP